MDDFEGAFDAEFDFLPGVDLYLWLRVLLAAGALLGVLASLLLLL